MSAEVHTSTAEGAVRPSTLREAIEVRRVRGERFTVREAVAIVVPLATDLARLHGEGHRFFCSPSAMQHGRAGTEVDLAAAATMPTHARDKAVIAPECRRGEAGDARASVFAIGAIFYELVTGEIVGPGMRRPTEIIKDLPKQTEVVLGKALVGDPKHRPSDLAALAQAFHHLSPSASVAPPFADESHLDHDVDFDVDVSLSMIPPAPAASHRGPASGPISVPNPMPSTPSGVPAARTSVPDSRSSGAGRAGLDHSSPFLSHAAPVSSRGSGDPLEQLAALKQRLESDLRPRYVVIKEGMDHGPFTAVELLQQIASHSFVGENMLRDTLTNDERQIESWDDFALFAHQAKLNRDVKQERKALEQVVHKERGRNQWKLLAGMTLLAIIAAGGVGFWMRERNRAKNEEKVQADNVSNVDSDAALSANKNAAKVGGGGRLGGGGTGSYPQISGGGSCEAAIAKYTEDYSQQGVPPDLTAGAYQGVLGNGSYLNSCGVPSNMSVSVCAAVQNGHAVGVTVVTNPSNPGVAGCIRGQVGGLGFPSHPRMDVVRTTFAAN